MLGANGAGRPSDDLELESPGHSRRSLLKSAAAAGAAGIAAAALASGARPAAAASRAEAAPARRAGTATAGGSEPVVVHVRDAATGEMDVFRGTTCTRVHDTELAARLVRAGG
jgi:anaerobic selenocysteine-containing dehydrogenase